MNPYQPHQETSKAAAQSIKPDKGRSAVLACLRQHPGGLTDEEIQGLTGLSPSTERPRRIELERAGKLFDSGDVRRTRSGRYAVVWQFNYNPNPDACVIVEPGVTWKERALLAEEACEALRRQIDQLQLELVKAQARTQATPFFDLWGVPRRET